MLRRGTALAFAVGCAACGSSGTEAPGTVPPADAGEDAPIEIDASSGIPRCGPGPWIVHREEVHHTWKSGNPPLAGLRVSPDLCPDVVAVTDANGKYALGLTHGVPYSLLTTHPTESKIPGGYSTLFNALSVVELGTYFFAPDPRVVRDPKTATIDVVRWQPPAGAPAPCNTLQGLRARVEEYPDAITHYWADGVDSRDPDVANVGAISIDGLPPDVEVTVVGEKPGCRVRGYWFPWDAKKTRTHAKYPTAATLQVLGPEEDAGVGDAAEGG